MLKTIEENFISVDFTLGKLIFIARENSSDFLFYKDNFKKSENFAEVFFEFINKNNINLDENKNILINLGPGSFIGLRNILSSLKALRLLKKLKFFGFNNFQIFGQFLKKKKLKKIGIKINNKYFCIPFNKYKRFKIKPTVQKKIATSKDTFIFDKNIFEDKKKPYYGLSEINYILKNKIYIKSNIDPLYYS